MKYGKLEQIVDDDTWPDVIPPPAVLPLFCPTCGGNIGYQSCGFCGGTGWWPEGKADPRTPETPGTQVPPDVG